MFYWVSSDMALERGPEGKRHAPTYRDGCYYGRMGDCCWMCLLRKIISPATLPVRYRFRNADTIPEHRLVDEEILVPNIDLSSESFSIEYTPGTVTEVYSYTGDDINIVTVNIEEEERMVHIDMAPETVN